MKLNEYLLDTQKELIDIIEDGIRKIFEVSNDCEDLNLANMEIKDILRTIASSANDTKLKGMDSNGKYLFNPKSSLEKIYSSWIVFDDCNNFKNACLKLTEILELVKEKLNKSF